MPFSVRSSNPTYSVGNKPTKIFNETYNLVCPGVLAENTNQCEKQSAASKPPISDKYPEDTKIKKLTASVNFGSLGDRQESVSAVEFPSEFVASWQSQCFSGISVPSVSLRR